MNVKAIFIESLIAFVLHDSEKILYESMLRCANINKILSLD